MARLKYTMYFHFQTNTTGTNRKTRVAGWSESIYGADNVTTVQLTDFNRLQRCRAALLPQGASIIGQSFRLVDGNRGKVRNTAETFSGLGSKAPQDIPQMGLLFLGDADGAPNLRRWKIAAIPDARVDEGEYLPDPTGAYDGAINAYARQIEHWYFRAQVLTGLVDVQSIDANGAFVLVDSPGAFQATPPRSRIQIMGAVTPERRKKSGKFLVFTKTSDTTGTLFGWPDIATVGGKARVVRYDYYKLKATTVEFVKVAVRKVGRPINLFVGRRSARR